MQLPELPPGYKFYVAEKTDIALQRRVLFVKGVTYVAKEVAEGEYVLPLFNEYKGAVFRYSVGPGDSDKLMDNMTREECLNYMAQLLWLGEHHE